jgi:tRNA 2-thiocytidine biosynthesis protein TtcA
MNNSKVSRLVGTAIHKHNMISDGDSILVGISGGKDSIALLDILSKMQKRSPAKFRIIACTIDSGFKIDLKKTIKHIESIGVEHFIRKTAISQTLKSRIKGDKTGDHCFLCSRLRRGFLYTAAKELGCNKIALGHNLDDRIETFLLNLFYSSNSEDLRPKYMGKEGIMIIRPLIDVPEKMISDYAKENNIPITRAKCPFRPQDSKRKMIKKMLSKISKNSKYFYSSIKNGLDKNAADAKD